MGGIEEFQVGVRDQSLHPFAVKKVRRLTEIQDDVNDL